MTNLEQLLIEIAWTPWRLGGLLEGRTVPGVLDEMICRGCRRMRGGCIAGDEDCPLPYGVADWLGWPYEAADGPILPRLMGGEGEPYRRDTGPDLPRFNAP